MQRKKSEFVQLSINLEIIGIMIQGEFLTNGKVKSIVEDIVPKLVHTFSQEKLHLMTSCVLIWLIIYDSFGLSLFL